MDITAHFAKTTVTLDEIKHRVAFAFDRNFLCRGLQFDIVQTPRMGKGANWTITMQQVAPDALWEASEIVSDIQDAYLLSEERTLYRAA
ncbi:hypothetical protein RPMA_25190 [Tardiphaga alba]|uniref:Uncharacterized protein n=1 Tax=Tardiphaga alba TaxID=340268 RepID=A0ABX8ADD6_9BRAD|nr:hypothetical protein [Tardiphaga alba]QUS41774.1 hypothetical protein RPMA_25190 [Tardiphaga alba]